MINKPLLTLVFSCCMLTLVSACSSSGDTAAPAPNPVLDAESNSVQTANPDNQSSSTAEQQATDQSTSPDADSQASGESANNEDATTQDTAMQEAAMLSEEEYPASQTEMELAWNASLVKFPNADGGIISTSIAALENGTITSDKSLPVAIYLHGCDGFWQGSEFRMNWLASQGFTTIAPNSLARSFYPESCNVVTRTGWQYKPTISMRHFDAGYALEQVRKFSWADTQNIFFYGFSEGAVIAATFVSDNPQHIVNARILEGWSCVSIPWQEYQGILAPESEPVLTVFADRDPWLQGAALPISCADFISQTNGSQSILVDYEPLRNSHSLLEDTNIQEIVLNFLLQQQTTNTARQ